MPCDAWWRGKPWWFQTEWPQVHQMCTKQLYFSHILNHALCELTICNFHKCHLHCIPFLPFYHRVPKTDVFLVHLTSLCSPCSSFMSQLAFRLLDVSKHILFCSFYHRHSRVILFHSHSQSVSLLFFCTFQCNVIVLWFNSGCGTDVKFLHGGHYAVNLFALRICANANANSLLCGPVLLHW